MSDQVHIFDTTLRDGEQSPGCSMTTPEKLRVARHLVDMGVDVIEAGFPIASEGDFEAVRAVCREHPGAYLAALARSVPIDIERAAQSLDGHARPRIHCFIATSEIHLRYKFNKSQEQVLEEAVEGVELARRYVDDVEFSAEDATRTEIGYLCRVCEAAVDAGASVVNIPDTVGFMTPDDYAEKIARVVEVVGDRAEVSVHTHDDLGLAVANSIAALHAGARQIECALNGIGERAGNCSLEEVVAIMMVRRDRVPYHCGIDATKLYAASQALSECITFGPQPNKAIVGRNAFAHEAGIHQDGYLKHRTTYEIMTPDSVGVPGSQLILGKHSGRHALHQRVEQLGYGDLGRDDLRRVYEAFTRQADTRKGLTDDDIVVLLDDLGFVPVGEVVADTV
ncbi:MAG: 2-isopropylmalate synthase [Acidobacteriia bacterium]|nr:2-isopropylmalate synthase [Terriglobia bacterium]MYK10164.1 2-isopropylmalate synthase [Terriglobia bacterium]